MAYASLTDIRRYLGITSADDDALLAQLLNVATAAIDTHTGRTFSTPTAETRYFDARTDVEGARLWIDDCCEITAVVNGDGSTIVSSYYVTEPRRSTPYYALALKANSGLGWTYTATPENAIAITGYWGYSRTPPSEIQQACVRWAGHMYRQKDAAVYDTQAMPEQGLILVPQGAPKDVTLLLRPYVKLV